MKKKSSVASPMRSERLENGIWLATEYLPHVRSASLGVYLDTGSRDESPDQGGLSHFFEHMTFKGTESLAPIDIVRRFEETGGQVNAYTSKEQTCFYAKVVDTEAAGCLDVLLDMVFGAKFDLSDVEKEKEVILEEIRGAQDDPEDLAYDLYAEACFGNHALGRPIAGTEKTLRSLTRDHLLQHREAASGRIPVAIVAVGRVDHSDLAARVRRHFRLRNGKKQSSFIRKPLIRPAGIFVGGHTQRNREVKQATVVLGGSGVPWKSSLRYPLLLMHCALGDGMSSRLFQNLREKHGLVYSIFSNPEFLSSEGLFTIGFGTEPKNLPKAMKEIKRELSLMRLRGLSGDELKSAKKNVTGSILLSLESTHSRMSSLARRYLGGDPEETLNEVLRKVNAVTKQDVLKAAKTVLGFEKWATASVLPKGIKADISRMLAD